MNTSNTVEEDMLDRMAEDMAREIDKELLDDLMTTILVDDGWTRTKVDPAFTDVGLLSGRYEEWYTKTAEWIHKNARGDYKLLKGQWLFKDPKDATMFILRWA